MLSRSLRDANARSSIEERIEGAPPFAEELTKTLLESGVSRVDAGYATGWRGG